MKEKKQEKLTVDVHSFYWNSIRKFDTIATLSGGIISKLDQISEEHPTAAIDIKTATALMGQIIEECIEPLRDYAQAKQSVKA